MRISIIVAVASNGVIGKDGKMPWHLPSDLKHFKKTTTGNAVVMGRKTFESIGKPLPNRMNIVLSRQKNYAPEGVHVVTTPEAAVKAAQDGIHVVTTPEAAVKAAQKAGHDELMVIGGGEVYRLFEPLATRVFLTQVQANPEGDTHFTLQNPDDWVESTRTTHTAQTARDPAKTARDTAKKDTADMVFVTLTRRTNN